MVRYLARGLSQAGVETHVATTNDNGRAKSLVRCGIPTVEDGVTYWYFDRQSRFYSFSGPLSRWLKSNVAAYDVVHVHALFSHPSVVAARWAARKQVPYILRPLGTLNRWGMQHRRPFLKSLSFRFIESRIIRKADAIHYTSAQERIEAARLGITSRGEVIPNAIEFHPLPAYRGEFRGHYPELRDRQIVLFLSRFDAKKGLDLLLLAFSAIRAQQPGVALVLAGSGDSQFVEQTRREVARLRLGSDVFWVGFLQGSQKQAALYDADVFVLPSYSENFGIAVVDALHAGLPVVISDQVAIHREVADANAGLVIPCDASALAENVLALLRDPAKRSEIGRNGRTLVKRCYSLEAVTRQLLTLYEEVLRPPRGFHA
jgi:glycosyltransferase involved in cell wall biosynthesis